MREQEKLRGQMTGAFGPGAFDVLGDQVRRNTEMFEQAMRMFLPFGAGRAEPTAKPSEPEAAARSEGDLEALRRQLDEMQRRLDKLSTSAKP